MNFRNTCLQFGFFLVFCVVSSSQAASVDSPGGLGLSNVTMWLDASRIDTTDTTNEVRISGSDIFVKRWDDRAGVRHASQAINDKQPQYIASGPNGRPVVNFDGAPTAPLADLLTMPFSSTLGTSYVVAEFSFGTTFSAGSTYNAGAGTSDSYAALLSSTPNLANKWQFLGQTGSNVWYTSSLSAFDTYYVNGTTTSNIASVSPINNFNFYGGIDTELPTIPDIHIGGEVPGTFGGHRPWQGGIPEVVTFSSTLNSVDRNLVENYLSSKYARPFGTPANDHYAGEGAGYDEDVFGIGNDGTSSRLSAGMQGIDLSANSLDSGDWLLGGHDGSAFALSSFEDNNNPDIAGSRWGRVWYLDKTGALDATMSFDFEDAGLATPFAGSTFHLLYSADSNFADGWQILAETNTITSGTVAFNLANALLLDGYYTLGQNIGYVPEPNSMLLMLGMLGCGVLRRRKRLDVC